MSFSSACVAVAEDGHTPVRSLRFVEMVARRQIGKLFQMLRAQWLGDVVFLAEPFAEINQLAAMRTERAILLCEPITAFLARRAFDLCQCAHVQSA